MNALTLNIQTMSSREIATLCAKEHKNVMADIRNMFESLNIQSAEFAADYKDDKGRTYPCFNLPKRETLILVSGYSMELRAKIIDRWQELETNPADNTLQKVASAFESLHKIAIIAGFQGNQAVLSADKGTQKLLGCSPLALIDATHLAAPKQELTLNPTQLGQLMTEVKSARKINVLLQEKGLQEKVADQWVATEKGREFSELLDTGKKHSDGTPIKQLKWFQSVLKVLN
jgi:phage regulator Rha-like protein